METQRLLNILIILIQIVIIVLLLLKQKKIAKKVMQHDSEIKSPDEFSFVNITVKEVMTPRTQIFALDIDSKIEDVIYDIVDQGFSRIPLYKESIDNIVGLLYIKDILMADRSDNISKYQREVIYVPENKKISQMLDEFRQNQNHMAIIIDEYGVTSGIITIEDILEEIVGEIRDEYDIEEDDIVKLSDNIYDVAGDTLVEEINETIGIEIPLSEEYDTISGYIQTKLSKVAKNNDQITEEDFVIKVIKVENKRIVKVKIILLNQGGNENDK